MSNQSKKFVDKTAIIQVLGNLFKNPELLEDGRYNFIREDFPEDFHKIIFECINNLYALGAKKISISTIEDYLSSHPKQEGIYKVNKGREYLETVSTVVQDDAFDFYYDRMKKFTLLRMYADLGLKLDHIYNPDSMSVKELSDQEERLNNLNIQDISQLIENEIEEVKLKYVQEVNDDFIEAGANAMAILEQFKAVPDVGIPMYGAFVNTLHRGARLGKFYLRSAATNIGSLRTV